MRNHTSIVDMRETDQWLDHLRLNNRKKCMLRTRRSNVRRCFLYL